MKTKRNECGDYEIIINGQLAYTITKGGAGWNIYEGDDVLKGWLDSADTLKEAKEIINH